MACLSTRGLRGARRSWFIACAATLLVLLPAGAVLAAVAIGWGNNGYGELNVPAPNWGFVALAAGYGHSLGLKSDGTVVAWGWNDYGQCNVPSTNAWFVMVSAGFRHSLGLKSDGTVVAWGDNSWGQCNAPSMNWGFVAVAAGWDHSLGLKADGTVVAWGANSYGQCDVPVPNSGFVAVAAGERFSLGLKVDGTVVAWGRNNGQCNVPAPNSGFIAVAAGDSHSLGLKSDSTVVAWGYNNDGQCNVPAPNSGFIAVAAGGSHSLGLKSDGTIVAWGYGNQGQCNVPSPNSGFVAVAAGGLHSLGLIEASPLGIYADVSGTGAHLCAERNVQTNLFLLGRVPASTPPGVMGVEFRIEVSNPSGYFFSYTPPNGGVAYGSPFDLTPSDPNDPTGATVLFGSCQLPSQQTHNLMDFGRINVVNIAGRATLLRIREKQPPGSASMPCARFFLCDAPFSTPVCMSPTLTDDIVYEVLLNAENCQPPPAAPFMAVDLQLDTYEAGNDGAAGPVSTGQSLDHRQWFLVTVQGTASLTGPSSWAMPPNVVCGIPEHAPQTPSPGVSNYRVGADAETNFAAALLPGSDCNSMEAQGYPRHHARFQVDLGSGFAHLEPLGGAPTDPAPSHRYRFLVQGQDSPASFRWEDAQTSDNYGVLSIRVEEVTPTDVNPAAESTPRPNRVIMLGSVPNPFNPTTVIRYVLAQSTEVTVDVYDIRGRAIRRLFAGPQSGGYQSLTWDGRLDSGSQAPSGTYFARMTTPVGSSSGRMTLVK